jgi:UDPglucose 6-dehydrogenase
MRTESISFIGLGKLGLPLACCLANSGAKIIALDKDVDKISSLKEKKIPFFEPGLDSLLGESFDNFVNFSNDILLAINQTDITILLLNTQVKNLGYSAESILEVIKELAIALKDSKKDYHLFILSSTIPPGTCKKIIEIVERYSGREIGVGFGFAYVPDFVKLGSVIKDFMNPEFFLIGANNERDFSITQNVWTPIHQNTVGSFRLTIEETEIAKIALNAYIINKITFANHLGLLCNQIENVNVHSITRVIGLDKRISPHFFSSGAPYGGTCFPRDVDAYIEFSANQNVPASHLLFAEQINRLVLNQIKQEASNGSSISILGVSFKPNSPVTIESPSLELIEYLINRNKRILTFDFISSVYDFDTSKLIVKNDPQDAIDNSDTVVLMHPDPRFKNLKLNNKKLIDPWGLYDGTKI